MPGAVQHPGTGLFGDSAPRSRVEHLVTAGPVLRWKHGCVTDQINAVIDIGALYASSRQRICTLVLNAGEETSRNTAAQACPGWSVHDIVAHLVGVVEDGLAGRLSEPPTKR